MTDDSKIDDVPQISGTFPLTGERVGPAWRRVWHALADGYWAVGRDLANRVAAECHLTPNAVMSLMSAGARVGLLERSSRREKRGEARSPIRVALYRRADATVTSEVGAR